MPSAGYGWLLLQMVLVLLAVCLLAYALLRFGMRRFQAAAASRTRGMRVVARLVLEPRRSIYVVEIAGRHLVVGSAESGLTQLAELDADTTERLRDALAQEQPRTSFKDILAGKKR
jgi:flagellar protein FliO/FliZ